MKPELKTKIKDAIADIPLTNVDAYCEDYSNNTDKLVELILALKNLSSPLHREKGVLNPEELHFNYLKQVLEKANVTTGEFSEFSQNDHDEICVLIREKFVAHANEIIRRHPAITQEIGFQEIARQEIACHEIEIGTVMNPSQMSFWSRLEYRIFTRVRTDMKKKPILGDGNEQGSAYRAYVKHYVQAYCPSVSFGDRQKGGWDADADADMDNAKKFLITEACVNSIPYKTKGFLQKSKVTASWGSGLNGGGSVFDLIIVVGIILTATVAYTLKKGYKSLKNIFTGNKVLRSLFRLAGIFAGGAGGVLAAAAIGSLLFPGIGTFLGLLIGTGVIISPFLGLALGALLTKQIARGISYLVHHETNVEKWCISSSLEDRFEKNNIPIKRLEAAMKTIREEKKEAKTKGDDAQVAYLNASLKRVKNGEGLYNNSSFFKPPMVGANKGTGSSSGSATATYTTGRLGDY